MPFLCCRWKSYERDHKCICICARFLRETTMAGFVYEATPKLKKYLVENRELVRIRFQSTVNDNWMKFFVKNILKTIPRTPVQCWLTVRVGAQIHRGNRTFQFNIVRGSGGLHKNYVFIMKFCDRLEKNGAEMTPFLPLFFTHVCICFFDILTSYSSLWHMLCFCHFSLGNRILPQHYLGVTIIVLHCHQWKTYTNVMSLTVRSDISFFHMQCSLYVRFQGGKHEEMI